MDKINLRSTNYSHEEHFKSNGISFDMENVQNTASTNKSLQSVLTKRSSGFQIDPYASRNRDKKTNVNGWDKIDPVSFWHRTHSLRVLRNKILIDLERHFGHKVEHNRLFSCLGKNIFQQKYASILDFILIHPMLLIKLCYIILIPLFQSMTLCLSNVLS